MRKTCRTIGVRRAAVVCLAILLAGCSTTVSGTEEKESGPAPTVVQPALLDHGNYPAKPRPPLGNVKTASDGRLLEGDRMANNVVLPYEVDPSLIKSQQMATRTMTDAPALSSDLPDPVPAAADAHGFIVGFSTGRLSVGKPYKELINLVMEFPDAGAATAAAGEMAAKYANPAPLDQQSGIPAWGGKPNQPFGIPRHPEALGSTSTNTLDPEYGSGAADVVSAFTAHGQYVLFQTASSADNVGTSAELVAHTLDMQEALIDRFMPAAPAQFAGLAADPTGLLAKTLPPPPDVTDVNQNAVYEPRAYLHLADEPARLADAFKATGVQAVSIGMTTVYQAIDAAAAQSLADTEVSITTNSQAAAQSFNKPIAGIDGYPAAKCFTTDNHYAMWKSYCVAPADRYLIEALGQQDQDTRQLVAAQYLILTSH